MTYEVRLAEYNDIPWIVEVAGKKMVFEELQEPSLYDATSLTQMAMKSIQDQTGFICLKDGERIGVIGGLLVPHFLNSNKLILTEIMWFVEKEYRNGRAGLLLIKEYADLARKVSDIATLSLLGTSPISDKTLERFGFKLKEKSYLMEV